MDTVTEYRVEPKNTEVTEVAREETFSPTLTHGTIRNAETGQQVWPTVEDAFQAHFEAIEKNIPLEMLLDSRLTESDVDRGFPSDIGDVTTVDAATLSATASANVRNEEPLEDCKTVMDTSLLGRESLGRDRTTEEIVAPLYEQRDASELNIKPDYVVQSPTPLGQRKVGEKGINPMYIGGGAILLIIIILLLILIF